MLNSAILRLWLVTLAVAHGLIAVNAQAKEGGTVAGMPVDKARICITGFDHNRPEAFPGLDDFIGWVGEVTRLANGELLFTHSGGYWHVSFATPIVLTDDLIEPYKKAGLDLTHKAPTGGRIMSCRSNDNGKTWSQPVTLYDGPLDASPSATFVTEKGTVIQIVNVQASWYGFTEAPPAHQRLNTRQLILRSTDQGRTWSEPKPINSSGTYYTRDRSRILQLPDGELLWISYDMNKGSDILDGTLHRSDDDGKSWRVISMIRPRKPEGDLVDTADLVVSGDADALLNLGTPEDGKWLNTDEGDLGRLSTGRLVLVVRPDGGTLVLTTGGSGGQSVFLSTNGGKTWSPPIRIDPDVYGYVKLRLLDDQSILMPYVQRHGAPQRCILVRFRVNDGRNGVELLPIGK